MKRIFVAIVIASSLFLSGCPGTTVKVAKPTPAVNVWWGTKAEIITFLNSEKAQSDRWMIQSIGN